MHFIDTHAHVYAAELTSDLDLVMKNALAIGINKIIMPAIDSSSLDAMLKVEQQFPENCIAMMGLHPCYVKENYKEELKLVEEWIGKRKFIAIGEIGLDFYWDKTFTKR
jgi:TatD DNase family protein